jgi:UDP-N-acetylmuramoylalanine--D-glutamate ligase
LVDADPDRARATLRRAGITDVEVLASLDRAPAADVALRSPGFSPYQPAVQHRIAEGLRTVTPLGLWLSERGDRPSVAITGTKGKSSTSVLAGVALEALGAPSVVVGNIGVPPWDHPPGMAEVAVVEISSYQAADLPVTAPIAALTAIGEDHVDWHGSVAQYLADKARVFTAPTPGGARWCAVPAPVELPPAFDAVVFARVPVPDGDLRASNARLAAAVALKATGGDGADPRAVADLGDHLISVYPDLPGRFSTVGTAGHVEYVDDALASNPLGLAAALRSLAGRPVAAIVGGADRGAGIQPVLAAIADRVEPTAIVCIDDAARLAERYAALASATVLAADLESAVAIAASQVSGGGVVLFSPGMPTPPGQGSWADRSRRFRDAVRQLVS